MTKDQTLARLDDIERQIQDAITPTGSYTTPYSGSDAGSTCESYRRIRRPPNTTESNPNAWPDIDEQLEDFHGEAFLEVYRLLESLGKKIRPSRNATENNVWYVGNYVKHRGGWAPATWAGIHADTENAIAALGERAPATPGQLSRLTKRALGLDPKKDRFSMEALRQVVRNA